MVKMNKPLALVIMLLAFGIALAAASETGAPESMKSAVCGIRPVLNVIIMLGIIIIVALFPISVIVAGIWYYKFWSKNAKSDKKFNYSPKNMRELSQH